MHAPALLLTLVVTAPPSPWTDSIKTAKPLVVQGAPSFWPIVKKVEPAVLVVFTEGPASSEGLPPGHPPIRPPGHPGHPAHPGGDGGAPETQHGQGAGFLISKDGYALTNHHVIEGATRVYVYVGDDHDEVPCDVVGSDEKSDVAVIRLRGDKKTWPFLPLANSDAVKIGDVVVAIGSPFGLAQSVSQGIVSARGRRDITPSGRQGLYDFLQTDASINPGNSGGPLLDVYGAVVGINAAVNAAGSGIGFAIPINQVKRMLPSIIETGSYQRSWIGVSIAPVEAAIAKGLGLERAAGALVREVVKGGPGATAGLMPGDVITRFDGALVHEANELPLRAGDRGIGHKVTLDVVRDRKPIKVSLVLQGHPDNARAAATPGHAEAPPPETKRGDKDRTIGLAVVSLDDSSDVRGARISRLRPGGPAFTAGLAKDDVIIRADDEVITSADSFADVVRKKASGDVLRVLVMRGTSTVFAAVAVP